MDQIIVVKVGTGVLTRAEDATLDGASLLRLVNAIAQCVGPHGKCILVSSGAVGAGITAFGLTEYPKELATKQAVSAVGQTRLMHAYENLFAHFRVNVAQLLRTADDFRDTERRANTKATLLRLLHEPAVVPIVNQNDTVAYSDYCVGDNDMLAVRVAELVKADKLVIFSSIDGLYGEGGIGGEIIPVVEDVDSVFDFAEEKKARMSMGGMKAKLTAVKRAVDGGIETCIANGREPERLRDIINGRGICTRFLAKKPATK
ncbi:glutamate 5-kinase [Oceaniferula flava]|uniref:glutamate 5-kinase n=1 Tax=Oceaniferula flava TaxID=2800421 RepID=UPI0028683A11|nr:glutamate 5-kinase [Oceaniferula flavus]